MRKIFQYIIGSRIAPIFIILIGSFFAFIISVSSPKPQKGIELPKPTPVFYEVITKKITDIHGVNKNYHLSFKRYCFYLSKN